MKSKIWGLLAVGLLAGPMAASASLITFEGQSGFLSNVGDFIDVGDFRFTLDAGSTELGFGVITPQDNVVTSGTTKLFGANRAVFLMTRIDSGAFNLDSFDIGGSFTDIDKRFKWASSVDVFASDGGFVNAIVDPTATYSNISANFSNILSVRFVPLVNAGGCDTCYEFVLDNLAVSVTSVAVPEPGTLALLGLGLVGMGMRRRIKVS